METKQEYIEKEIKDKQRWLNKITESHNSHIASINQDIEDLKNLSDEKYEKIAQNNLAQQIKFDEEASEWEKLAIKAGLTLEQWDNMSFDETKIYLETLPEKLRIEIYSDYQTILEKFPL